jgi:regulatory protein
MRNGTSRVRASGTDHAPSSAASDEKQVSRAKNTAYRYLSIRPRSRSEIERKLADKEFPGEIINLVMLHLDRLGYANDREFAGLWARNRTRFRGLGRRRIEQELRAKGISREIIQETLAQLFVETGEIDIARKEAEKKLRTLERFEPEVRRRRLAGFLERKGHSPDVIRAILRESGSR